MADYFLRLSLSASLLMLAVGAFLLFDSVSHPAPSSQLVEVLGAAQLIALGLILFYSQGKRAWRRLSAARHEQRDYYS